MSAAADVEIAETESMDLGNAFRQLGDLMIRLSLPRPLTVSAHGPASLRWSSQVALCEPDVGAHLEILVRVTDFKGWHEALDAEPPVVEFLGERTHVAAAAHTTNVPILLRTNGTLGTGCGSL